MAMTASVHAFDTLAPALHGGRDDRATKAGITAAEKRMPLAGVALAGTLAASVKLLLQAAP